MVIKPLDYGKEMKDPDVLVFNSKAPKKKQIKNMPDVIFANKVAQSLQKNLQFNLKVSHNVDENIDNNDFIFSGEGWLDPGPNINCKKNLPDDIEEVFHL